MTANFSDQFPCGDGSSHLFGRKFGFTGGFPPMNRLSNYEVVDFIFSDGPDWIRCGSWICCDKES